MAEKNGFVKNKAYVKTPTVFQMESTECGAAALSMILAYYGKELTLEQLRVETGVSRDGSRASNMVKAAEKLGLNAKGFRYSLKKLTDTAKVPCIIHWQFNHFVVFEGKKGKYYYINDPSSGRVKLTLDELDDGYTGITLQFSKKEDFKKEKKKRSLIDFSRERLKGQGMSIISLVVTGMFLVVPGIMMPVFAQVFIDEIIIDHTTVWFVDFIILMASTIFFQGFFTYLKDKILIKLRNKMALMSAYGFVSHLLKLPMEFYSQRSVGDLTGRVENNNNVSSFLAGDLGETVLNIYITCFYLVLLIFYSPVLTIVGLTGAAINIIVVEVTSKRLEDMAKKMQQDNGKLYGALYTGLTLTDSLKAAGSENIYAGRVIGQYGKVVNKRQEMSKTQEVINSIPEISNNIINVIVIVAGGILVIRGKMSVGELVAYISLLASFVFPVNSLVGIVQKIQTMKTDMQRVDDVQSYRSYEDINKDDNFEDISRKLYGNIEVKNISFGYSLLDKPLIEDFSFELKSGKSIAIIGPSGSGKSTITKIISGLYNPWKGEIFIDGMLIDRIPKEVRNLSVGCVNQQSMLFAGTIRDNLTMWNNRIMESDIVTAAKDACIHDLIVKKPGAYSYVLSEGGSNMSCGQRQRLEIARALVTNPSVLIMDEATSALDPITEKQIVDNIKRRGCTCIVVAHRLSAIRDCDEIIIMDKGKIVQRGTHDELKNKDGKYKSLIKNL